MLYTIKVRGRGSFPLDMLRYDCCWPQTEQDAGKMEASFRPRERMERTINLTTALKRPPEAARWRSFGWQVVGHD